MQGNTMRELFSYDNSGNILSLRRENYGQVMDDLRYGYDNDGNKLLAVQDLGNNVDRPNCIEYHNMAYGQPKMYYDANGNLVADRDRDIRKVDYNVLNLPISAEFGNGEKRGLEIPLRPADHGADDRERSLHGQYSAPRRRGRARRPLHYRRLDPGAENGPRSLQDIEGALPRICRRAALRRRADARHPRKPPHRGAVHLDRERRGEREGLPRHHRVLLLQLGPPRPQAPELPADQLQGSEDPQRPDTDPLPDHAPPKDRESPRAGAGSER